MKLRFKDRMLAASRGWGRRWGAWGVVAVLTGVALRIWFAWQYGAVTADSAMYGDLAQNLLRHGVYGLSATDKLGHPAIRLTLIRLPGYPLFLAACFLLFGMGNFSAVLAVQAALDLWTCLLLAATARKLFGRRAGLAALWMAALCPFMANYAGMALTETPTLFCMALAFYGFVRWVEDGSGINRWLVAIGFALTWAVLLRPEQGMLAAMVVPAMVWQCLGPSANRQELWTRRVWLPAVVVSCLTVLPLVPWTARNWRDFHVLQPLAPKYANDVNEWNAYGFDRWYRTWAIDFASTATVYWQFDGQTISIADLPDRAFDSKQQYERTAALLDQYNLTTTPTHTEDADFAAIAAERVAADPLRYYVALPVARLVNMWLRPRVDQLPVPLEWWKFRPHPGATLFAGAYALLNLGYLALAAVGLTRRAQWQAWKPLVYAMVGTIAFRSALLMTIDNSEPRYTLEFFPVLIVLGSAVAEGIPRLGAE
jgi:4-amino-4-deoxy-L-arabinose transferase-like glycosyltransferase